MSDIPPVERRTYFPATIPEGAERRACPRCGRATMIPWYLRRDRERRVWRLWVCVSCQADLSVPEDDSA